jgi:hypothetical protein
MRNTDAAVASATDANATRPAARRVAACPPLERHDAQHRDDRQDEQGEDGFESDVEAEQHHGERCQRQAGAEERVAAGGVPGAAGQLQAAVDQRRRLGRLRRFR